MVTRVGRYFRLLGAFARFCLANEMAFRGNFVMKVLVEVLWLGILLVFYQPCSPTPERSPAGTPPVSILSRLLLHPGRADRDAVPGKRHRLRRHGADRQPRLLPAQADRRAVPRQPAQDRLVHGHENPARRRHHGLRLTGWAGPSTPGDTGLAFGCCSPAAPPWPTVSADALLDVRVAGPQREPDGVVVAVHDADALPARKLQHGWSYPLYIVCWYIVPVLLVINVPADRHGRSRGRTGKRRAAGRGYGRDAVRQSRLFLLRPAVLRSASS